MCANLKISVNINKLCEKILLVLQGTVLYPNEGVLHLQHKNCEWSYLCHPRSLRPVLED